MPGTVTALEVQQHDKERVSVFLDNEYAFSLTLIEAARLRRGQALSDVEIAELRARDAVEQAVVKAVRFLSYRPRSISEVRANLSGKGIDPSAVDAALERLAQLGYLDDQAFARYWVSNREEFRPKGPLALRQELREKGISSAICDEVLAEVDFSDAAYRAAQSQIKRLRSADRRTAQRKLYDALLRRGFRSETAMDVVTRVLNELEIPHDEPVDMDDV